MKSFRQSTTHQRRMSVGEEAKSTCPMPRRFRPAGAGVDIIIRYITRAGVRVETRNHLFAMIVVLMQGESKDDTNRASLSPQVGAKG